MVAGPFVGARQQENTEKKIKKDRRPKAGKPTVTGLDASSCMFVKLLVVIQKSILMLLLY